jgi:hypothetical protein
MVIGVAVGIALPLQPAAAQVAGATQVTDPAMLESMGFARNANNVYMAPAVGLAAQAAVSDEGIATPQTTPTTGTDFSALSAKEFIGRIDTTGTEWRYTGGSNSFELTRVGTEMFADAQFSVPTGATLTFFRFWAFDNNPAANLAFFVFEVCQPGFSGGAPVFTTIVSTQTNGTPGHTSDVVTLNQLVNNQDCTYVARVRFDAADPSLALQKVRLQFDR